MEKALRFTAYGLAGSAVLLVVCCILGKLVNTPSNRVIWQTCQPEGINYGSFDPYCVAVVEGGVDWQYAFFMEHRRYSIFIGRGKDVPAYGHSIEFSFTFGGDDPDSVIQASQVEWSNDGLTFIAKSGHRLFVPKAAFIGGR